MRPFISTTPKGSAHVDRVEIAAHEAGLEVDFEVDRVLADESFCRLVEQPERADLFAVAIGAMIAGDAVDDVAELFDPHRAVRRLSTESHLRDRSARAVGIDVVHGGEADLVAAEYAL